MKANTPTTRGAKKQLPKQNDTNEILSVGAIRSIFEEMFQKHEQNIATIISSNNTIINQRLDNLSKEVSDLTHSLQFFQNETDEKLNSLSERVNTVEEKIKQKPKWAIDIEEKLVDLEDRSRRNNLRFEGLAEDKKEPWQVTTDKLYNFIERELHIDCKDVVIERAHRAGTTNTDRKPRAIVAKFLSYQDKIQILRNCKKLKGTPYCVYEDFSKETVELRKKLWKQVLINRDNRKVSFLNYRTIVCYDG